MSSVASQVHAASSFASSRQPQIAGLTADTDNDPFTAMFDAMAAGQDPTVAPGTAAQPDTKPAATPTAEAPAGNSAATSAKTTNQTADQSGNTTTSASGASGATATDDQIFTATAGGNLIQAATAMKAGDSEKSSAAGGKGKTGAGSIADKLSGILAAAGHGTANNGDATTNAAGQSQVSASSTASPDDSANAANTAAPGATDVAGIIAAGVVPRWPDRSSRRPLRQILSDKLFGSASSLKIPATTAQTPRRATAPTRTPRRRHKSSKQPYSQLQPRSP